MSSANEMSSSDMEDKTATLTLDGSSITSEAEADQWLRDNGVILPLEPAPSAYSGASSSASTTDPHDPSVPSRPPRRRERKKSSPPSPKVK